ncbi:MAG: hypothetical protein KDA37_13275, partial [Planctomycetales bacterium]|nr:hypothetical protein [Planctomycetales bacterium]
SQKAFDDQAARLAQQWLALDPPRGLYAFLEASFAELAAQHGGVVGRRYPTPKLVLASSAVHRG